jgi:hypothetical protein
LAKELSHLFTGSSSGGAGAAAGAFDGGAGAAVPAPANVMAALGGLPDEDVLRFGSALQRTLFCFFGERILHGRIVIRIYDVAGVMPGHTCDHIACV